MLEVWLWKLWGNIQQDEKGAAPFPGGPGPTLIFAHSLQKDKISYHYYYLLLSLLLFLRGIII